MCLGCSAWQVLLLLLLCDIAQLHLMFAKHATPTAPVEPGGPDFRGAGDRSAAVR